MKITNLFSTTNIYNKTNVNDKKIERQKKVNDSFVVSDQARDFQTVLKAISNAPDIREEKVNDILKRIEEGSYNISANDIADKLLSK
nr:flagellar biosynthesis anti-sigma factor FlgM [uncultured Tyzzerella sp.]